MVYVLLYISLVTSLFLIHDLSFHAVIAFAVSMLLLFIPFQRVIGGIVPILFFLLFTFAGNLFFNSGRVLYSTGLLTFTDEGLHAALLRTLRVFSMIFSAKILTARLPLENIIRSLERVLRPLEGIGVPVREFFSVMGLTVKAFPLLMSHLAQAYREHLRTRDVRGFRQRIRCTVVFLLPVFTETIRSPESFFVSEENEAGN